MSRDYINSAGMLKQSMGARNRVARILPIVSIDCSSTDVLFSSDYFLHSGRASPKCDYKIKTKIYMQYIITTLKQGKI
jgi:hypothetical protein